MSTIQLMINGIPGNVAATIFAHAVKDTRFKILPFSLTGPDAPESHTVEGVEIALISPDKRSEKIDAIKKEYGAFVAVDYTHPTAVDANVAFYCDKALPFVMGTTGGDREKIRDDANNAAIPSVIAPNMAKQIVGLQAMIEFGAKNFPGLFAGYTMKVKESHQSWKADTSGTAKAIIRQFNALGIPFSEEEIEMVRDPQKQKAMGIPEEHIDGHGWHTYSLTAGDGSAEFGITHNINGRDIYAEGTLDAVVFLHEKLAEKATGCYSMIDVLKKG